MGAQWEEAEVNSQHALGQCGHRNETDFPCILFKGKELFISRLLFYGKKLRRVQRFIYKHLHTSLFPNGKKKKKKKTLNFGLYQNKLYHMVCEKRRF